MKNKRTELSLFSSRISAVRHPRKSFLKNADRMKVIRLRSMLEKKRLLNTIEKLKLKSQIEGLKNKGKPITPRFIQYPINAQPVFTDPNVVNDINSAFKADIGFGDDLWGNERYFDENYYDEDFYTEDYFGDAGIRWLMLRRREGNPLFW